MPRRIVCHVIVEQVVAVRSASRHFCSGDAEPPVELDAQQERS